MHRSPIHSALCCGLAAPLLSGCFFGNLDIHRERAAAAPPRAVAAPERGRVSAEPHPAVVAEPAAPTVAIPMAVAVPGVGVPTPVATAPVVVAAAPVQLPNVIRFDDDAYVPRREFDALLLAHAERLKADRGLRLLLKGHDDAQGGRYGQALAAKRAETVAKTLRAHGAFDGQLEIIAMPSEAADPAQTRRVDLIYR